MLLLVIYYYGREQEEKRLVLSRLRFLQTTGVKQSVKYFR